MKLKPGSNGILIDEQNFQLAIAEDGKMRELWYKGNLEGLEEIFGMKELERSDPFFAENLVEDLR